MADGVPVYVGAAACPSWMPFGTQLRIEGVGDVTCHDRYREGLSDRIDVFVPSVAEAYRLTGQRLVWSVTGASDAS